MPFFEQLLADGRQEASYLGRTVVRYESGREQVMSSAHRCILAVALFITSSLSGAAAFPQAANFIRHAADPRPLASAPADKPAIVPSVNPCNTSSSPQTGCNPTRDLAQEYLASMGKPGQKILRAREKVLEILQTENACSAWFREKDPNPADTFRTLNFEVDRHGQEFILESKESDNMTIFRNPYVAKVFQGDGRYATITINANGAFFTTVANVLQVWKEDGPVRDRRPRATDVGPYLGDSMHAQVLVLLHEFGHVLDILPTDENDVDGKSVQNTKEVLRFCRAEVESKTKRATLSAAR